MELTNELGKITLGTLNKDDSLIIRKSMSFDEEQVFVKIEYKIFKMFQMNSDGSFKMESKFGKPEEKMPVYSVFSTERIFRNNYFGWEELEKLITELDSENKVREHFHLGEI